MKQRSPLVIAIAIVVALVAYFGRTNITGGTAIFTSSGGLVVHNQSIYDQSGRLAYQGDIDLSPTFERIRQGKRDSHNNDGAVFRNLEKRLPLQRDKSYYREYVIRTPNIRGPGPQRLVTGKQDEAWYTPNHYQNFMRVRP
jgi:ribonuclease T1